jgi:hypothetical protein
MKANHFIFILSGRFLPCKNLASFGMERIIAELPSCHIKATVLIIRCLIFPRQSSTFSACATQRSSAIFMTGQPFSTGHLDKKTTV